MTTRLCPCRNFPNKHGVVMPHTAPHHYWEYMTCQECTAQWHVCTKHYHRWTWDQRAKVTRHFDKVEHVITPVITMIAPSSNSRPIEAAPGGSTYNDIPCANGVGSIVLCNNDVVLDSSIPEHVDVSSISTDIRIISQTNSPILNRMSAASKRFSA